MKPCEGGVTAALGFTAAGARGNVKGNAGTKRDVALIVSDRPATAAAMFTKNQFKAAPVLFDQQQLAATQHIRAIVANSGNANACTGARGLDDCRRMAEKTAEMLGCDPAQVLVASTGVIGRFLPIDRVCNGIETAAAELAREHHRHAMEAIMTTDTHPKEYALAVETPQGTFRIGGMAKGSGMIKPNMATMLAFLTTDAQLSRVALDTALRQSVEPSFHRISVDNDTSTNDTIVILANGQSGVTIETGSADYDQFCAALAQVCVALAKMLARDGEGATKLIEINIRHAASPDDALTCARAVADSYLVKTAIFGKDPNWGRIVCALGYAGVPLIPERVTVALNGLPMLGQDFANTFDEADARKALESDEVVLDIDLGQGEAATTFWTSDLSYDYVKINAEYTT
jgi:glutamate N-acetyltransferase / amino-acid N-acetyltransferase